MLLHVSESTFLVGGETDDCRLRFEAAGLEIRAFSQQWAKAAQLPCVTLTNPFKLYEAYWVAVDGKEKPAVSESGDRSLNPGLEDGPIREVLDQRV